MPDSPLANIRRATESVLRELLRPGEQVALLDYPLYFNPGDALIYLGTLETLSRLDVPVSYTTDLHRYSPVRLAERHPRGPILLQGGGNFGDQYPRHQSFRERVLADFPDRRIIQLPQSTDMSVETAQGIRRRYVRHAALTVLLRDTRSMRFAEQNLSGVDVRLCPDLAFGYSPRRTATPTIDVIELKRVDRESIETTLFTPMAGVSVRRSDWRISRAERLVWNTLQGRRTKLVPLAIPMLADSPAYETAARMLVRSAHRMLEQGRIVVTDRLHAAVLAALIGRAVVARDNANRKLSAIIEDYLGDLGAVMAPDAEAAAAAIRRSLTPND
ncbi:polysaccharide pyruvyl transferase family protein [Agromyces sp. H66]|uniref:polysaccharide pyruvyl transferase family protein n=1 Tax=Agromyces sp. H66 TaxID=2529859 RepID=UPI0010AA7036|nr:polysaccharide pyruvyl transferase family protein [Agromyces sp. H66]